MSSTYTLEQYVYDVSKSSTTNELQNHWGRFVGQIGTDGYRIIPAPLRLQHALRAQLGLLKHHAFQSPSSSNHSMAYPESVIDIAYKIPSGWREYYQMQGFFRNDPVLAKELMDRGPFTRKEALSEYHRPGAEQVVSEAKNAGIPDVIAMSLCLSPEILIGIALYLPDAEILHYDTTKLTVHTASYIFCTRYHELSRIPDCIPGNPVDLTSREKDVLRWIALGKTKQEIAEILFVSTSCVKRYCESASFKLQVNNMPSAVARAMTYGLLNF